MAEAILYTITAEILKKLASTILQQINLAVGVEQDLKKLEKSLSAINYVLLDAEQKQSTSQGLRAWLQQLQDVLYDADNILDSFAYIAIKQRMATRYNSKSKVRHIFSSVKFNFKMGNKIKEIREKLDQIASDRAQFQLTEGVVDWHVMSREMTHSFVDPSNVIGRIGDTKNIVDILTCSHTDRSLSIVPIVGIGGLGKTTIAKLVYNDKRVNECFQLKMWVCVSDDFNLQKLTKDIYQSATNCGDLNGLFNIDQLQSRLRSTLRDTKFLLVLDDVWNEVQQRWTELQQLLINGAKGSKIIVTTRSLRVASIMGAKDPYILKGLSDEDCWSLFVKCAFQEGEEKNYPNLEIIGKQIIKKCKGVPLAVRSLGSMLFMKTDEYDWLLIEKSELCRLEENESGILPALRFSYNQLPSNLKRCFAFCSIFPKDFEFNSRELIEMWMSQGLIQSCVEHGGLEKMGLRYIKELYSRCFFQDILDYGKFMKFKMHDLVHDLSLLMAQNECCSLNNLPMPSKISEKVRHVSLCIQEDFSSSSSELDLSNLWTLYYFPKSGWDGGANESFVRTCMPKLKFLRMLDMRNSNFEILPESIGKLNHLRYLNISRNKNIKKLPDAICKLLHLQTLDLKECSELEGLPRDIGNLINLRRLWVSAREIYLVPNKQIGLLTSLRDLHISHCDNVITCSSDGMECIFPSLRTLVIEFCGNLRCWAGIMKHLTTLEVLEISYCRKLNMNDGQDLSFPSLQYLGLHGLGEMKDLPEWVKGNTTLQSLEIWDCKNLTRLPNWMQKVTSLEQFEISECPKISEMCLLPSLIRELRIFYCGKLSDKRCFRGGKDWHKIKHIPNIRINSEYIRKSGKNVYRILRSMSYDPSADEAGPLKTSDDDDEMIESTSDDDDDEIEGKEIESTITERRLRSQHEGPID